MKVAVYSAKPYDREFLTAANVAAGSPHDILFLEAHLDSQTARLAAGAEVVCPFVNDHVNHEVAAVLAAQGTRLIALRGAGFNNVDLIAAEELGMKVARVPAYSPSSIAEHAVAMMLALDRNIHRAYLRVREGNFALDGLLGFDLHGRTAGIVGTGRIGMALARIMNGFGCKILASDPVENAELPGLGGRYVPFDELLACSDIISLHCPLTPATHHLIGQTAIERMKRGVMLVNTSRGAVVDTHAVIWGLKRGIIGHLALDVYEEEGDLFFENLSNQPIQDDLFARLLTFPNVLITGHQAFFTREAMEAIGKTTIDNITSFQATGTPLYEVTAGDHLSPIVQKPNTAG